MTHEQYLESYHELTQKVLTEVAIRNARGEHESAAELVTQLRAKLSDLWQKRVVTAKAGVGQ